MKKEVNYIYLFRHGKTDFNERGIFTGWKDSKLTSAGILNAKTVAKKLKNKRIDVAIHTRLSRSKDTLKYVLEFHPECKKIIWDDRMIEKVMVFLKESSMKSLLLL
jgi:bisphosphoglycerate-dependent phosphoglycerate mutase